MANKRGNFGMSRSKLYTVQEVQVYRLPANG